MTGTIYSLIPPLIMIILVLLTRKVTLSLGVGIIIGALFIHEFNVMDSIQQIWSAFYGIFVAEGGPNMGTFYLLFFLIFLGMLTAFMSASGGTRAFGEWAITKIQTKKGAQLLPFFLGIIIFIDDYFNSLAIGQVARPLTDRHKISRAKLAYLIDSTSAPVAVLSPISSWGAFIIGTIGAIIAEHNLSNFQPLESFVRMIPMNIYAIIAIFLVFLVVIFKLNLGAMRKHEQRAEETGELVDPNRNDIPGELKEEFVQTNSGRIYHLTIPIVVLIISTIAAMVITGRNNVEENATLLTIFENTNVNLSLFIGGLIAVYHSAIFYLIQMQPKTSTFLVLREGIKSMLPAIYILILAWVIGTIIENLGTGDYLALVVERSQLSPSYLPVIVFIVCGIMAFATGTSWGTFGIMLPIVGQIAVNSDVNMLLASLAAVLAGSVFGDHCSPISDTSILSSTGAGSNHIDHVLTQIPYAVIAAIITIIGYVVLGITGMVWITLILSLVLLFATALILNKLTQS
ncbi:Na+/H+ antiporter NhaC family protein [Salinibacillus xinjiangensis]|uniref:Na+/H+ antiporter NhaC family protein n=1 Tax=Salinibacillus xinjiangensis TaxID=1229268 RepID=A0A6G1X2E3_9BACI|nr:Na+/H+ antiporter NhaC family protein [Salinibacillus xinjiangensis]MRG85167.1 Na+/H+ antiporter NhaC family protein [Salinibacillus xinjiangensis]